MILPKSLLMRFLIGLDLIVEKTLPGLRWLGSMTRQSMKTLSFTWTLENILHSESQGKTGTGTDNEHYTCMYARKHGFMKCPIQYKVHFLTTSEEVVVEGNTRLHPQGGH